ncbi:hypothetical protein BJF88_16170 [Cellulosimicrobium sp. CUA-896]|nr:hypothetical protein BJF88_16170 [Cellulosimicrobium sp. CUA-896]
MLRTDMPIAAIYKDAHSGAGEDQVSAPAWEYGSIDVEASAATVEFATQGKFGLRVATSHAAHARTHHRIDAGEPRVHCARMPYSHQP